MRNFDCTVTPTSSATPIYNNPPRIEWPKLISRAAESDSDIDASVRATLEYVWTQGDKAVLDLESRYDNIVFTSVEALKVSDKEIAEATASVSPELKAAIAQAYSNIRKFHSAQMPQTVKVETSPGVVCYQKAVPLRRVGLYIPGGRAPLFSTVLMLAVPASVAGCPEIVLCTPPDKDGKANPVIVYTASVCGVRNIFKIGGAQAIAAMAYGTETLAKCDKIFGPGNRYVMKAKQMSGCRSQRSICRPVRQRLWCWLTGPLILSSSQLTSSPSRSTGRTASRFWSAHRRLSQNPWWMQSQDRPQG